MFGVVNDDRLFAPGRHENLASNYQRGAMFYFNPKLSIEVCLYHRHASPLYGGGVIVSCFPI